MHNAISPFLASSTYHPCLLLVHSEVCTLQEAANELVPTHEWLHLSIGRELSAALLSEPPKRRSRAARRWMESRLSEMAPGPVLCTEIDLLFEPTLSLDPLRLLRHASRVTRLVITWPGSSSDNVLSYAAPEHDHYRTWRKPEVFITVLE